MSAYGPSHRSDLSPPVDRYDQHSLRYCFSLLASRPRGPIAMSDFYKSKPVTLIVGSSAGGGYDTLARTVARFLGRHLPGNPSRVRARTWRAPAALRRPISLYNAAEKDGSQIGLLQNNTPFEPIFGQQAACAMHRRASSGSARPSVETAMLAVRTAVPVASLDDTKQREITVGAAGINSTPAFYARLHQRCVRHPAQGRHRLSRPDRGPDGDGAAARSTATPASS